MQNNRTVKLTESAIALAFVTVLSLIKLVDLPYGGSITIASMLPLLLIAYRHGTVWGLFTGFAGSLIQLLLGLKNISYATSMGAAIAIILLDYVLAFTFVGLGGIFRKGLKQPAALTCGALVFSVTRFICHVISGCTAWAGLSIPSTDALLYSLSYNATYMIPETIVLVVTAFYIGSVLDFRGGRITRLQKEERTSLQSALAGIAKLALACAAIYDVAAIFSHMQDPESGEFAVAQVANAPWCTMGIVTGIAVVVAVILMIAAKKAPKNR